MADRIPLRAIFSGVNPVSFAELQTTDTVASTWLSYDPTGNTYLNGVTVQAVLDEVETAFSLRLITTNNLSDVGDLPTTVTNLGLDPVFTHVADDTLHRVIDDGSTSTSTLWSSTRINSDISAVDTTLSNHTTNTSIHAVINDTTPTSTTLFSGNKITNEIVAVQSSAIKLAIGLG